MVEERGGWFVINVQDSKWATNPAFGRRCILEQDGKFPQTGVGIHVLEPGQPNCRYHREEAQEDFLVLQGECTLLVAGHARDPEADLAAIQDEIRRQLDQPGQSLSGVARKLAQKHNLSRKQVYESALALKKKGS